MYPSALTNLLLRAVRVAGSTPNFSGVDLLEAEFECRRSRLQLPAVPLLQSIRRQTPRFSFIAATDYATVRATVTEAATAGWCRLLDEERVVKP